MADETVTGETLEAPESDTLKAFEDSVGELKHAGLPPDAIRRAYAIREAFRSRLYDSIEDFLDMAEAIDKFIQTGSTDRSHRPTPPRSRPGFVADSEAVGSHTG